MRERETEITDIIDSSITEAVSKVGNITIINRIIDLSVERTLLNNQIKQLGSQIRSSIKLLAEKEKALKVFRARLANESLNDELFSKGKSCQDAIKDLSHQIVILRETLESSRARSLSLPDIVVPINSLFVDSEGEELRLYISEVQAILKSLEPCGEFFEFSILRSLSLDVYTILVTREINNFLQKIQKSKVPIGVSEEVYDAQIAQDYLANMQKDIEVIADIQRLSLSNVKRKLADIDKFVEGYQSDRDIAELRSYCSEATRSLADNEVEDKALTIINEYKAEIKAFYYQEQGRLVSEVIMPAEMKHRVDSLLAVCKESGNERSNSNVSTASEGDNLMPWFERYKLSNQAKSKQVRRWLLWITSDFIADQYGQVCQSSPYAKSQIDKLILQIFSHLPREDQAKYDKLSVLSKLCKVRSYFCQRDEVSAVIIDRFVDIITQLSLTNERFQQYTQRIIGDIYYTVEKDPPLTFEQSILKEYIEILLPYVHVTLPLREFRERVNNMVEKRLKESRPHLVGEPFLALRDKVVQTLHNEAQNFQALYFFSPVIHVKDAIESELVIWNPQYQDLYFMQRYDFISKISNEITGELITCWQDGDLFLVKNLAEELDLKIRSVLERVWDEYFEDELWIYALKGKDQFIHVLGDKIMQSLKDQWQKALVARGKEFDDFYQDRFMDSAISGIRECLDKGGERVGVASQKDGDAGTFKDLVGLINYIPDEFFYKYQAQMNRDFTSNLEEVYTELSLAYIDVFKEGPMTFNQKLVSIIDICKNSSEESIAEIPQNILQNLSWVMDYVIISYKEYVREFEKKYNQIYNDGIEFEHNISASVVGVDSDVARMGVTSDPGSFSPSSIGYHHQTPLQKLEAQRQEAQRQVLG